MVANGGMKTNFNCHPDAPEIIARWPSVRALSEDAGVAPVAVVRWRERGRIPPAHFVALIGAAKRRGIYLTYEELAASRAPALHQTPRAPSPARGQAAGATSRAPAATKSPA